MNKQTRWLVLAACVTLVAGCGTTKEKPAKQRGWIGGQFQTATPKKGMAQRVMHPGVLEYTAFQAPAAGVRIKSLGTNTPAALAGLREADVILAVNNEPVSKLRQLRKRIDGAKPGTQLPISAYREGATNQYSVTVGRETYRSGGNVSIVFPSVIHGWDLWPNPGFSLVLIGCHFNPGLREEAAPAKTTSTNSTNHWNEIAQDEDWRAWVGIFEVSKCKRIGSQGLGMPKTDNQPGNSESKATPGVK